MKNALGAKWKYQMHVTGTLECCSPFLISLNKSNADCFCWCVSLHQSGFDFVCSSEFHLSAECSNRIQNSTEIKSFEREIFNKKINKTTSQTIWTRKRSGFLVAKGLPLLKVLIKSFDCWKCFEFSMQKHSISLVFLDVLEFWAQDVRVLGTFWLETFDSKLSSSFMVV